eukprot:10391910-Heterocapsa_arctica.AAC.1
MDCEQVLRQEHVSGQVVLSAGPREVNQSIQSETIFVCGNHNYGTYVSKKIQKRNAYCNPKTDGKQRELYWFTWNGKDRQGN